jgi:rsbT antagonist protein RsbS
VADDYTSSSALSVPLQLTRGCIVASVQVELSHSVLVRFREELLSYIKNTGATSVIVDLSGVGLMDRYEFDSIKALLHMVTVMGARPMLAGLRAEVVSSLIDLGARVDGVEAAFDLDDALERIERDSSGGAEEELAVRPAVRTDGDGGADLDETPSYPDFE